MNTFRNGGRPGEISQRRAVYCIFRVYGLESGNVRLRVFVDPDAARGEGRLDFEAEEWKVTPKEKPQPLAPVTTGGSRATEASVGAGTNVDFGVDFTFGAPAAMPAFGSPPHA
jgi:hypothetical protein